jgi:hypothetical protein
MIQYQNNMEHKIINTGDYLLIAEDSEIKEGDWVADFRLDGRILVSKWNEEDYEDGFFFDTKKIIAHLPLNNSPRLENVDLLPDLPLLEDDIYDTNIQVVGSDKVTTIKDFLKKHNKEVREYTEEDMIKCWKYASIDKNQIFGDQIGNSYMSFIQSLQQPNIPVIFKRKQGPTVISGGLRTGNESQPPGLISNIYYETITDSEGNTQWLGEWVY